VLALAHAYPTIPVYDDEGWNAEIPARQGDVTYTDASFYVVKITAPKDVTVVSAGTEIRHSQDGQTQTVTVADGPARDFYLAASPDYKEITKTSQGVTLRSYAPADLQDGAEAALDIAAKSLELYDQLYVSYPYTELDIVATPTLAGGIEYPGLIVVTSRAYKSTDETSGVTPKQLLEGIVAHEVGHQWFYNLVGDDQLDDPWLDEAFAQYLSLEYFTDQYGPQGEQGFRASLENRWKSIDNTDMPIGLPVTKYTDKEYGAIVYGRGPLFLVALKDKMGAKVFNEFLKDYVTQLSWGIATPEFMQTLAEKHCSCDLDPLFQEWVYP
jgi:aminopeptidase N